MKPRNPEHRLECVHCGHEWRGPAGRVLQWASRHTCRLGQIAIGPDRNRDYGPWIVVRRRA